MTSTLRILLCALGLSAAGCQLYNPTITDCSLTCTGAGPCPTGTTCRDGYCRPADAKGACDCVPGDQRPCGGGKGECKSGVQFCGTDRTWSGSCLGEVFASAEICDGRDNDCDGVVDNAPTDLLACEKQLGLCAGSKRQCVDGGQPTCDAAAYGSDYQASETRCDGKDNDCDGEVDVTPLFEVTPRLSNEWFLFGYDGGFAALYTESAATDGDNVYVRRFDAELQPLGPASMVLSARKLYFAAANAGPDLYLAGVNREREGEALRVGPTGTVDTFQKYPGYDYYDLMRAGVSASGQFTVSYQGKVDDGRVVTWALDGGLLGVRAVGGADAGVPTGIVRRITTSRDGQYVYFDADPLPDGGAPPQLSFLVRASDGALVRQDVPECGGSYGNLWVRNGKLQGTYVYNETTRSGVATHRDLLSTSPSVETLVESTNGSLYGEVHAVPDEQGWPLAVVQRAQESRLELTLVVDAGAPWVTTSRVFQTPGAYGPAQVAVAGTTSRIAVATASSSSLNVRLVCAP